MFKTAITVPAIFGERELLDGIQAAGDLGIDGIEFFDWESQSLETVTAACGEADIELVSTLSAGAGSNIDEHDAPALTDPDCKDIAINDIERSIDACEAVECPNLIVTVGPDQDGIARSVQHATIVEVLSEIAPRAEGADVTIVVEPLNIRIDHPGYFLTTAAESFDIVSDVDSPKVKVLFDIYHQQITEGDVTRRLIENIELVGHVHIADNPGRHEPGAGELNYAHILTALAETGYEDYVGCEFFPEEDPEDAVNHVLGIIDSINEG